LTRALKKCGKNQKLKLTRGLKKLRLTRGLKISNILAIQPLTITNISVYTRDIKGKQKQRLTTSQKEKEKQ